MFPTLNALALHTLMDAGQRLMFMKDNLTPSLSAGLGPSYRMLGAAGSRPTEENAGVVIKREARDVCSL